VEFDKAACHAAAAGYAAHVSAVLPPASSPTCVSPVREGESLLDGEELPRPGGSPRHGLTTPRLELVLLLLAWVLRQWTRSLPSVG
jgi:hypothetical protein